MIKVSNSYVNMIKFELGSDPPPLNLESPDYLKYSNWSYTSVSSICWSEGICPSTGPGGSGSSSSSTSTGTTSSGGIILGGSSTVPPCWKIK